MKLGEKKTMWAVEVDGKGLIMEAGQLLLYGEKIHARRAAVPPTERVVKVTVTVKRAEK